MKNSNDTIGNRFRDFPVCSAVPQPLRHRVPHKKKILLFLYQVKMKIRKKCVDKFSLLAERSQ
jgi:hypothetical protein